MCTMCIHIKTISILKKPLIISQTPVKQVTMFSKLNGIVGFLVESGTKKTIAFFCTMIRVQFNADISKEY